MNAKIYNGDIQPNPKEFKIWVNDEGLIKTWNGTEWVEQSGTSNDNGGGSGSGSGSGESGIEYTYLDLRGYDIGSNYDFLNIIPLASIVNYKGPIMGKDGDVHYIMACGLLAFIGGELAKSLALAIDERAVITDVSTSDSKQHTIKEAIEAAGSKDLYNSIPRITKEQFYNLEA